jgi:hypothetical protein
MSQGYNIFRVAFSMERLTPGSITSSASDAYLKNLTETVNYITDKGSYAILDPYVTSAVVVSAFYGLPTPIIIFTVTGPLAMVTDLDF